MRGRVFTDVGSAWAIDGDDSNVNDTGAPRMSVGTGFSWISPFGPVVIDVAVPILKESYDKTELINFSFGTRF